MQRRPGHPTARSKRPRHSWSHQISLPILAASTVPGIPQPVFGTPLTRNPLNPGGNGAESTPAIFTAFKKTPTPDGQVHPTASSKRPRHPWSHQISSSMPAVRTVPGNPLPVLGTPPHPHSPEPRRKRSRSSPATLTAFAKKHRLPDGQVHPTARSKRLSSPNLNRNTPMTHSRGIVLFRFGIAHVPNPYFHTKEGPPCSGCGRSWCSAHRRRRKARELSRRRLIHAKLSLRRI